MNKSKIIHRLFVVILSFFFLAGGVGIFSFLSHFRKPPQRKKKARVLPLVVVQKVKARQIKLHIEGYGRVRPLKVLAISPQVQGEVIHKNPLLKKGFFLKKNQLLIQIDPTNYQLAIQRAKANVNSATARQSQLDQTRINLQTQILILTKNVQLAKDITDRTEKLFHKKVSSQSDLDQARQSYFELVNRQAQLENQLHLLPDQKKEAQAAVDIAKVSQREAKIDLDRTKIQVPFDCRVVSVNIEVGSRVSSNTVVATIEDVSALEIPVMIPEEKLPLLFQNPTQMEKFRKNKFQISARIFASFGKKEYLWTGEVVRIEPLREEELTIPVVIRINQPSRGSEQNPPLLTGKFARVQIDGRRVPKGFILPRSALQEGDNLYLVTGGKLEIRPVTPAYRRGDDLIFLSGLADGDRVILSPLSLPVPGMGLRYREENQQKKKKKKIESKGI